MQEGGVPRLRNGPEQKGNLGKNVVCRFIPFVMHDPELVLAERSSERER
jgi:hypothetical protein